MNKTWYTLGTYENIECANCGFINKDVQSLDHHPSICPKCQIECIWYDLGKRKVIQIIPDHAPPEFNKFIKWAQKELDEIEFVELFVAFEELAKKIEAGSVSN